MEKKWFIGIDISKKTLDVVIYDSSKKKADSDNYKIIPNTKEGYMSLRSWLKEKKISLAQVAVCMEHTGVYSFDLRLYLEEQKIDYTALNPLHLKRSMGLVRGKNDKVDAERIAYFAYLHRDELIYSKLKGNTILHLKDLNCERRRFVKQLAEDKAYLTEMKDRKQDNSYNRTQKMVAILEEEIKVVETEMEELINQDETLSKNYALLTSIKGIGKVNAISTIIHTDNFNAFQTARQYACYLGVAPFEHSSGTSVRGKTRVSKTGAKQLKADLTQAARSASVWDRELKQYYDRKIKEGKEHGTVINAVKFKLVGRMFAVVKRGSPFVDIMGYKS